MNSALARDSRRTKRQDKRRSKSGVLHKVDQGGVPGPGGRADPARDLRQRDGSEQLEHRATATAAKPTAHAARKQ